MNVVVRMPPDSALYRFVLLADANRELVRPADLEQIREAVARLQARLSSTSESG